VKLEIIGFLKKDEIESNRIDYIFQDKEVFYLETKDLGNIIEIPKIIALRNYLKEGNVKITIEFLDKTIKSKQEIKVAKKIIKKDKDIKKENITEKKELKDVDKEFEKEKSLIELLNKKELIKKEFEPINEEDEKKEEIKKVIEELQKLKEKFRK
jgi:uncharacterized protein YdaL